MKCSIKPVLAVLACALLLSGCSFRATNYRLTIEVEDNGVVHTGAGVWRYEYIKGWSEQFRAQAIPIDLGDKGTVYALLRSRSPTGDPSDTLAYIGNIFPRSGIEKKLGATALIDCELSRRFSTQCPYMVRFRDERDPATVEAVDPADLSLTFGPGVKLRPIKVTVTKDGVTKGLVKRLPWMKGRTTGALVQVAKLTDYAEASQFPLSYRLNASFFSEGMSQ
jgi:hypothetical protein